MSGSPNREKQVFQAIFYPGESDPESGVLSVH